MKLAKIALPAALMLPVVVGACASYGPPPGYHGEGWRRHVHRCMRNYPRYNPRTDMIERPDGAIPCPL